MAMTKEDTLRALDGCAAFVSTYKPARVDPAMRNVMHDVRPSALHHLSFMIAEAKKQLEAGKEQKAHRWLGFIQGALWAFGYTSIESMKDLNRPAAE